MPDLASRMLKKSASLSCSFDLFGLSRLSGLSRPGAPDRHDRPDRPTRQTGLIPDVRTIECPGVSKIVFPQPARPHPDDCTKIATFPSSYSQDAPAPCCIQPDISIRCRAWIPAAKPVTADSFPRPWLSNNTQQAHLNNSRCDGPSSCVSSSP